MPDRIEPVINSGSDYVNELERLVTASLRRLDQGDKDIIKASLQGAANYVEQLARMPGRDDDDPDKAAILRALKAERLVVENMLWAEARERADALLDGVIDASMDLVLNNALKFLVVL